MFELIKESLADFHLASYLIDEVQIGSVDSVSKLWEDIFTTFPVDSVMIALMNREEHEDEEGY